MTESDKHINFKQLVVFILEELKKEGMIISNIHKEVPRSVDRHIELFKRFDKFLVISNNNGTILHKNIPYTFYLICTDDECIKRTNIFLNLENKQIFFNKIDKEDDAFIRYNNLQDNFVIIKIKEPPRMYNRKQVNLSVNGSLFLVGIKNTLVKKYYNFSFNYKFVEHRIVYEKIRYDVGCRYKKKHFGIEIGNSNHHKRKRTLVLDYIFLDNNPYLEIKTKIKKFLIKHSKVT